MPAHVTQDLVMYVLVPLWLAAGFADWLCHRRSGIEFTTGIKESLIHWLMFVEVGIPMLAALFLEVNAMVLALMAGAFLVHEATALWDVSYAVTQRTVTPLEQHMHSFLEMLPLMAVGLMTLLHWDAALSAVGLGNGPADWRLHLKTDGLPGPYLMGLMLAILLFAALPYANELWRCVQARRAPGGLRREAGRQIGQETGGEPSAAQTSMRF